MNNKELFEKRARVRKLGMFPELTALGIGLGASFFLSLIMLLAAWRREGAGSAGLLFMGVAYLVPAALCLILRQLAKKGILETGDIPLWIRRASILLIPFALTGNIFAAIAGFTTARKSRSVEYNLLYYAFLNNLLIILISSINLFKDQLAPGFWTGITILALTLVFYLAAMAVIARAKTPEQYKRLRPLAVALMATVVLGNLFALMVGMVILARIRNEGSNKSIEWIDTIRRIFRNYMSVLGLFVIVLLLTLSVCSAFTFDYTVATSNDYSNLMVEPCLKYPFGTDDIGRCVFTRIVFGARISLIIGMISTAVPLVIGGLLGAAAGHYGTRLDNTIMRVLDVFYAVPSTLLTIAIVAAFGANTVNLIVALSISNIPIYARTMRAQVMVVSNNEFVEAARACGRKPHEILLRHIIPNSLAPMIVRASVSIGIAVLSTSSLSYLGLGVEPRIPEWGNILKVGSRYLETNPYLAVYPGIFIIILVLAFNFLGDGLRDALDPKLK